ncbi:hypothetical protein GCM10025787_02590 [Saccharopolyspora rosea]
MAASVTRTDPSTATCRTHLSSSLNCTNSPASATGCAQRTPWSSSAAGTPDDRPDNTSPGSCSTWCVSSPSTNCPTGDCTTTADSSSAHDPRCTAPVTSANTACPVRKSCSNQPARCPDPSPSTIPDRCPTNARDEASNPRKSPVTGSTKRNSASDTGSQRHTAAEPSGSRMTASRETRSTTTNPSGCRATSNRVIPCSTTAPAESCRT